MSRSLILSLVFIIALTFMISCSGGDGNMVAPTPMDRDTVATPTPGTTACFGLWQITIDPATGTGDIVQLRSADKIINVLGFMEPPPLTLMDLDWPNLKIIDPVIEVGIILTHPIPGDAVFTGFDVRGVCFGPEVTNADGLTIIPSPEFFSGVPFGYQDGLLGAPDSVGNYGGLAGYKYFCDGLGATEDLATFMSVPGNLDARGSFGSGETNQRDFILDWTNSDQAFFVFNYAIYANYDWPVGDPPINLDSFEITSANCAEVFCAKFTELANSLYYLEGTSTGGGSLSLQMELWDWQGDISNVTIESVESGIIAQTGFDVALGVFPSGYSYGYEFYNVAATPTEVGDLELLITVTDSKTFGEYWFLDLLETSHAMYNEKIYSCFNYTTTVSDEPPFTWDPVVTLIGTNAKCRAVAPSPIPDVRSSYATSSSFNVTGSNADGGTPPITYEYYASTSSTDQVGSPSGWTSFTFDAGGSFGITWLNYSTIAPSDIYIWVHATDGSLTSAPVLCSDTMHLAEVLQQNTTLPWNKVATGSGWYWATYTGWLWFTQSGAGTGNGYCYNNTPFSMENGANYTFEWYCPIPNWFGSTSHPDVNLRHADDNNNTGYVDVGPTWHHATSGPYRADFTATLDDATRHPGIYVSHTSSNTYWRCFIDDFCVYRNPD